MKYYKRVVGEKLYLSPVNIDDAPKYTEWLNDTELQNCLSTAPQIITVKTERDWIEKASVDDNTFAFVNLETDELIGGGGYHEVDERNRRAFIGLFIGDKDFWHKGYGTEAINLLLDYGFNVKNFNSIMLEVFSYNERALACYEKCGFKIVGRRREGLIRGNKKFDTIYMDILSSEFNSNNKSRLLP